MSDNSDEEFVYSDDEEMLGNDDEERSVRKSNLTRNSCADETVDYVVLTQQQLYEKLNVVVQELAELLHLSKETSTVLLLKHNWEKMKVLDAYYADPEKALEAAGARQDYNTKLGTGNGIFTCPIILEEFPMTETFALGCVDNETKKQHRFSVPGWRSFFCSQAKEANCVLSKCPYFQCPVVVPPAIWEELLSLPQDHEEAEECGNALQKYERFLASSFVDRSASIKWCPTPGCGRAVMSEGNVDDVICSGCSKSFCFRCGSETHVPVSCILLSYWNDKCQNESESANWIIVNTRSCPKCKVRIEKNHGCNHMTCQSCAHHFCWICMGDWNDHSANTGGYYSCNKYKGRKATSDLDKAKEELDKYLFFYKRFVGHDQSKKFAGHQMTAARNKMEKMFSENKSFSWVDVQFLEEAVEQVMKNRVILKYSYVLGFYLPEGKEKILFEHNQTDLERYTEHLSSLTEQDISVMDQSLVSNYVSSTRNFAEKIVEACESENLNDLALEHLQSIIERNNEDERDQTLPKKAKKGANGVAKRVTRSESQKQRP